MTQPASPTPAARILLADDDVNFRRVLAYQLGELGHEVTPVPDGAAALAALHGGAAFDLVLSDVRMPPPDGLALLGEVHARWPELPFILITAHGDVEMAVEALHAGATDFITKPYERERLRQKIERALRMRQLERENVQLREELLDRFSFEGIIGQSPAMLQLFDVMKRVAPRDTTVLLLGESGTGKELVARALHGAGPRRKGLFVALNCAAIPASLLESELFGHVRGAFTGADSSREGRFQLAHRGTLMLDEIGDMPLELQAKLLRAIQERVIEPVGASKPVPIDVRIIAATHRDLPKLVAAGEFREDLYYRLNVVPLHVPPLRDRLQDIPLLVQHFVRCLGARQGDAAAATLQIDADVFTLLAAHDWPGNVRELENTIERALALRAEPTRLQACDLLLPTAAASRAQATGSAAAFEVPAEGLILDDVEKQLIASALLRTDGNQTRAAQLLGISRQTLIYRMSKHGLA